MRHREKWRLALDMIGEMAGRGGWGVLEEVTAAGGPRPVVAADIAYGDNALFREQLTAAGWQYLLDAPRHSWAATVARPRIPWRDLGELARALEASVSMRRRPSTGEPAA